MQDLSLEQESKNKTKLFVRLQNNGELGTIYILDTQLRHLGSRLGHWKFRVIQDRRSGWLLIILLGFPQQKTLEQKEGERKYLVGSVQQAHLAEDSQELE